MRRKILLRYATRWREAALLKRHDPARAARLLEKMRYNYAALQRKGIEVPEKGKVALRAWEDVMQRDNPYTEDWEVELDQSRMRKSLLLAYSRGYLDAVSLKRFEQKGLLEATAPRPVEIIEEARTRHKEMERGRQEIPATEKAMLRAWEDVVQRDNPYTGDWEVDLDFIRDVPPDEAGGRSPSYRATKELPFATMSGINSQSYEEGDYISLYYGARENYAKILENGLHPAGAPITTTLDYEQVAIFDQCGDKDAGVFESRIPSGDFIEHFGPQFYAGVEKSLLGRETLQCDIGNATLVQAMHELTLKDNAGNRKKMYEALLSSTLLIPMPERPAPSSEDPDRSVVQLVCIKDKQGQNLTPAFTDIEALRNFDPNTRVFSVDPRGFFQMISKNCFEIKGVLVNPCGPGRKMIRPSAIITRGEFEVLARGQVPMLEAGGLVRSELSTAGLGASIEPPNQTLPLAVAEVLRKSAESFPEIATLYAFSVVHPHSSPQLTVGVALDRNATKERELLIVQTLWSTVARTLVLTELKTLDFVVLTGIIAASAEDNGSKIYQRPLLM